MKILFFSDTHGDMDVIAKLKKKSFDADVVICAGDVSVMEANLPQIMEELNEFKKPLLLIHGNHENERGLKDLCQSLDNVIFLHKAVHHMGDYVFFGYGGDGFSTNDPEFTRIANAFFRQQAKGKKRMILVTHGPAYNTEIDKIGNEPTGNKSYRQFIDDLQPHLAVSGHLHENAGRHHKIGRTLFLNPGKNGAFVDI
jgi:Icc-related predicted phosphoesterase